MLDFFSVTTFCQKDVVGITRHVVTTISAFSFTMLLLDRILTHIVNHKSNTSYHLQYLYCQGGYVFGTNPNLITCVGYIFLSADGSVNGSGFNESGSTTLLPTDLSAIKDTVDYAYRFCDDIRNCL